MTSTPLTLRAKLTILTVVVVLLGGGAGLYVVSAAGEDASETATQPAVPLPDHPSILLADARGELVWVDADNASGERNGTGLHCDRSYYAAGTGVCVTLNPKVASFEAQIFDRNFTVTRTVALPGTPSRARVSRDGRFVTTTNFVYGDDYAAEGQFSTRALIVDASTGAEVLHLEEMTTTHDGKVVDAPEVNYWGVTFTDDPNVFYATLAFGGQTHLIRGDVAAKSAVTMRENVECPSLSPDGTRLAYKKKDAAGEWHPFVLDLATGEERQVSTDIYDDQIEWLDDSTILYGAQPASIRSAAVDSQSPSMQVVSLAQSPAVIR